MKKPIAIPAVAVAVLALAGGCAAPDVPRDVPHPVRVRPQAALAGAMITLRTSQGGRVRAYETGAKDAPAALLLLHEWWGLNEHVKRRADQYAALGYQVVALDLYDGRTTVNSRVAAGMMRSVPQPEANRKMAAALAHLARPDRLLGTLGWCFGGGHSLQAAMAFPELVDATVIFYGRLEADPQKLSAIDAPVLGIFASLDSWITPDRVDEFARAMQRAGRDRYLELHRFDADHAFANPSGAAFDEEAAAAARNLAEAFLARHLALSGGVRNDVDFPREGA